MLLGLLLIGGCQSTGGLDPRRLPIEDLVAAPNFQINIFAIVPGAASLATAPDGIVHVATTGGEIVRLEDRDQDGVADDAARLGVALRPPVALASAEDGAVYAFGRERIVRLGAGEAKIVLPSGVLPAPHERVGRYIAHGPDGRLYLSVGRSCDGCRPRNLAGSILDMRPDGHELEMHVRGLGDPGALDWHPATERLAFSGQVQGPVAAEEGVRGLFQLIEQPVGRPATAGLPVAFEDEPSAGLVPELIWTFAPGLAPAGMEFYDGERWPSRFRNALLVVLNPVNGSAALDRTSEVVAVRFSRDGRPDGEDVLLAGWRRRDGQVWGRPVDIERHVDGSVLIADELAGVVYRLDHRP